MSPWSCERSGWITKFKVHPKLPPRSYRPRTHAVRCSANSNNFSRPVASLRGSSIPKRAPWKSGNREVVRSVLSWSPIHLKRRCYPDSPARSRSCFNSGYWLLAPSPSHILRHFNAEHSQRLLQLRAKILRHPQQERLLLDVRFGKHRIFVIKITERLRQLKCVPSHVRRFTTRHGPLDRRPHLRRRQQQLPAVFLY